MEEKRDQEELKHVCKLCNKRYPSGKSLGGHMRSHVIANSHKNKPNPQKVVNFDYDDEDEDEDEDEDDNEIGADQIETDNGNDGKHSGYGLRENPKKTWRLVGSPFKNNHNSSAEQQFLHYQQRQHQQQERVCKQCGKGFQSLKALCGHMSSHSDKERNFKEEDDYSWSSDSKEQLILATESHSDNNNFNNNHNIIISNNTGKRQTRSSLSRYRSLATVDSLSPTGNGGGSSSNHSEIDQHEQEEVAMCLMMLSRDSSAHHKSCFNFTAESSDNNSVILEGGSSSNYVGVVGNNKRKDFCLNKDNKKKTKQVIVVAKEEEEVNVNHKMDNSDSGYFENGAKELESDDSVDGLARNHGFKKPKNEFGSRLNAECFNYDDDDSRKISKIREVGNFSFDSPESDENCSKKIMKKQHYYNKGYNNSNNIQNPGASTKRGSKNECWVCNKTFKTHQALGGHIISHRKIGENRLLETRISAKKGAATNTKVMPSKAKKVKGHKCPYCPKVFKSGQALGGHKRSHMMGGGSNVGNFNLERAPPPPESEQAKQPPLIDLNLPAPMEEEGSGSGSEIGG